MGIEKQIDLASFFRSRLSFLYVYLSSVKKAIDGFIRSGWIRAIFFLFFVVVELCIFFLSCSLFCSIRYCTKRRRAHLKIFTLQYKDGSVDNVLLNDANIFPTYTLHLSDEIRNGALVY